MARVLIVDDSMYMRSVLADLLEDDHEIVDQAENGEEALELIEEHDPDLVTLDLVMPEKGGLDVLRDLSKDKVSTDATIVVVSAVGQEDEITEALSLGAADYITKPFDDDKVVETISSVLG